MTSSERSSAFAGFRFPREVIAVAVGWYLRYGLSYRDVEEPLAERGVTVGHVTIYRWVQRFTPEFIEAARLGRHAPGDRWFADETYVKVAGRWTYLNRAIDQHGQVIDVLLSARRDLAAARRFFILALRGHDPGRGHHRPRPGLSAGPGRADPLSAAYRRALREQPGRSRPWPPEGAAAADARTEASPVRADHLCWARVRAEHPPGHYELATDIPRPPSDLRSIRRARDGHLISPTIALIAPCHAHRSANATLPSGTQGRAGVLDMDLGQERVYGYAD